MDRLIGKGFAFVQLGRAPIRDPEFVNHLAAGELASSDCDSCNRCVAAMSAHGARCALPKLPRPALPGPMLALEGVR